jgi:DNA-binding transcriptional MerR regulator
MKKYICIKEASELCGVTTTTLRRWESNGKLIANHRTLGNHRRYNLNDILNLTCISTNECHTPCKTICSTHTTKRKI